MTGFLREHCKADFNRWRGAAIEHSGEQQCPPTMLLMVSVVESNGNGGRRPPYMAAGFPII